MTVVFYLKCDERDSRSVSDIISLENIVRIPTTSLHIGELKSYAMAVSAETLAGSGPRSASLNASTLESGRYTLSSLIVTVWIVYSLHSNCCSLLCIREQMGLTFCKAFQMSMQVL